MSTLIGKKDDVVADNMIFFLFGREPLLIKPAPFFRLLPSQVPKSENENKQPKEKNLGRGFGILAFFFLFSGTILFWIGGDMSETIPLGIILLAIGGGGLWLFRRYGS